MRVIDHIDQFEQADYTAVTIGTFDGVHIGHQEILNKVVNDAQANGGKSVLITFWPHPRFVLNQGSNAPQLLSTFDEKCDLLTDQGMDYLLKIAFTPEFSDLSADHFVRKILIEGIHTSKLFIGYDHHFGNNREGNIDFLRKNAASYGFEIDEISQRDIDDIGVSSTSIRKALADGEIHLATSLLGRNYTLSGEVKSGDKKGRTIGFPTANLQVADDYKLLPRDGVYAVRCTIGAEKKEAMLNIGFRPTLQGTEKTVEVHIFNFSEDIYGKEIAVEFVKFLRSEVKFDSMEQLKDQLVQDKSKAIAALA